jgi:molybdenum cofactor cytidylyltransferase
MAAGQSSRFDSDKRFAKLPGGNTMIEQVIQTVKQTQIDFKLVIKSSDLELEYFKTFPGDNLLVAKNASQGLGASLSDAVTVLEGHYQNCLICLADMPYIKPETYSAVYQKLIEANQQKQQVLAVIPYVEVNGEKKQGHPIAIHNFLYDNFKRLNGEKGGRDVLYQYINQSAFLEVDDLFIIRDIDTAIQNESQKNEADKLKAG